MHQLPQKISSLTGFGLLLMALAFSSACAPIEFEDEFDTEFVIPKPERTAFGIQSYTKGKRFTFESDPADAESARIKRARISVIAPQGRDLTFLHRLEVHVAQNQQPVQLLGVADGFKPGETQRNLTIEYTDDVRHFIENKKVSLQWKVQPSGWILDWPEEGITVRTEVTMLIETDIL